MFKRLDNSTRKEVSVTIDGQPVKVPDGETVVWRNPDRGGTYQVTPAETYRRSDGRYCRDYVTEVLIDNRVEEAVGTACRQPDGSWKVVRI